MADYFPLISRAVAGLSPNTKEARESIYARARDALSRQLQGLDPPIPDADLWRERNALEETIRRVEAQFPAPVRSETRPVVPSPVEPPASFRVPTPKQDGPKPPAPPAVEEAPETVAEEETVAAITADEPPLEIQPQRPKVDAGVSTRSFGKRRLMALSVAIPGMLGLGALAYVLRDDPALYERKEVVQSAADPAAPQRKADGRLDGSASTSPATGPRPAAPVAAQPGLPVAARAIFFEEVANDPRGQQNDGQVIWRLENTTAAPGQPADVIVRGSVTFPNARMGLEMIIERNRDRNLPASHTIKLLFSPEGNREGVTEIGPIEARDQEAQPGFQLRGAMVPVGVNLFLVGLDRSDGVAEKNIEAMRDQRFFAFQFRLTNGRVGAVLIEKGVAGDRVIREATDYWKRS